LLTAEVRRPGPSGLHGCLFGAQRLGVTAFPGYQDDEVVGALDQPLVPQALLPALAPLPVGSHLLLPLPGEVVIQG
jgi:hypothetical protein